MRFPLILLSVLIVSPVYVQDNIYFCANREMLPVRIGLRPQGFALEPTSALRIAEGDP